MRRYVWWVRGREHAEMAALSIASVQKVDPFISDRELLVITDDEDGGDSWIRLLPNEARGIGRILTAPVGRPAMVANLDAQIAAMLHSSQGDRVLFLDADTLIRRPFAWTEDDAPDLYVTWRDHVNGDESLAKAQPYNYGVIGARVRPRTVEAFFWLRWRILQMARKHQDWYGNQLALAELVGRPPLYGGGKLVPLSWALDDSGAPPLLVMCLHCDTWNYSPSGPDEDISSRAVLHLKGGRKDWMAHYSQRLAA